MVCGICAKGSCGLVRCVPIGYSSCVITRTSTLSQTGSPCHTNNTSPVERACFSRYFLLWLVGRNPSARRLRCSVRVMCCKSVAPMDGKIWKIVLPTDRCVMKRWATVWICQIPTIRECRCSKDRRHRRFGSGTAILLCLYNPPCLMFADTLVRAWSVLLYGCEE